MQNLVSYASSDEEEDDGGSNNHQAALVANGTSNSTSADLKDSRNGADEVRKENESPAIEQVALGPIIGPSIPDFAMHEASEKGGTDSAPQSPYSRNKALLQNMTLPTTPNLDIPPSPLGSPSAATNAKFEKFRALKAEGSHFNQKLGKSVALRNPGFVDKLYSFAGISEEDQRAFSLPLDCWRQEPYPSPAFKEGLAVSQKRIMKESETKRMEQPRTAIEFAPARSKNGKALQ